MSLLFSNVQAQIPKKVRKAAQRGVERTVEKRVEKEASKKTDEVLDEVFDENGKSAKEKRKNDKSAKDAGDTKDTGPVSEKRIENSAVSEKEYVTGSHFFPGGDLLYADNFDKDTQGDFPASWETSSGGEIITIKGKKALQLYPNGVYLAGNGALPENYAIEFDLTTENLAYKGTSGSAFDVIFSDQKSLAKTPANGAKFRLPLWYKANQYVAVENWGKGVSKIFNKIDFALDSKLNTTTHFTLVVNGKRLRVYLDNQKVVDLPSLLQNNAGRYFSFFLWGTNTEAHNHIIAISDIRITQEGQDLRSQILKGGFSTTQILFASNSDKLQPSSYTFLDELAQTLRADQGLRVTIIGHTDSDGDENANLTLSQKRAESVKKYLTGKGVAAGRLQTDGKGESRPVASNDTEEGKAQNRRVEFVRSE